MNGLLTRLFRRILDVWCATESVSPWLTICFFVALLLICGARALVGAVPTFLAGHDNFFFLENGWRALNGLRTHLDFWSPWGPLTFLVVALGLKLSHGSPNGLAYGTAIFGLLIGLWTYRIGRERLAPVPRALLGLYAAALACAPYPLGWMPTTLSPAMLYNRYGYALLLPVLLECFQRLDRTATSAEEWTGGISTGAALGFALFLKASYFFAGLGLVAASLVVWFPSVRRCFGFLAGLGLVSFFGLAYLRFDSGAMLRALHGAAAARAQDLQPTTPIYATAAHLGPLFVVVTLAVAASFLKPPRSEWFGSFYLLVAAIIVYIGDIALLATNMQPSGLPLICAFALLIANRLADSRNELSVGSNQFVLPYFASVLLIAGLLFVPQFAADVVALPISAVRKIHPPPGCSVRFNEPRVASLLLCDRGNEDDEMKWSNGSTYTTYVNEGVALLRRYGQPTDRVLTMDMQNPFPYVLGWQPARGGLASTSFNYTVSDDFRPSFDDYFGDATIVMIPKHPAQTHEFLDGFNEIYEPEVEQRFRLIAESDWFRMYRRK
jgi:hypothetical protein